MAARVCKTCLSLRALFVRIEPLAPVLTCPKNGQLSRTLSYSALRGLISLRFTQCNSGVRLQVGSPSSPFLFQLGGCGCIPRFPARKQGNVPSKYKDVKLCIQRRKQWIETEFKSQPCKICGCTFPPCAMDFHHRDRSEKRFAISGGSYRKSRKALLEEISKCDLLCSNCHRIIEHQISQQIYSSGNVA